MKEHDVKHNSKDDSFEIPVGKYVGSMRKNPWMPATIVLAIVLVLVLIFGGFEGFEGSKVSAKTAGDNLVSFIDAQGKGDATISSAVEKNGLYEMNVSYNGQMIPVYVTTDGKYLITQRIPIDGSDSANPNPDSTTPKDVAIGDSPSKGSKDAKVTIVEFTDYQCPFCGKYYSETYLQIQNDYVKTGKVRYVFKDFPLTQIHPEAQKSAEAARCVRDQLGDTGYFAMHDKLFVNQQSLSSDNYKKWAVEVGAGGPKFNDCLDSGKYAKAVQADQTYGASLGISGTPSFFINGIPLTGAQPYSAFKQIIDSELAK